MTRSAKEFITLCRPASRPGHLVADSLLDLLPRRAWATSRRAGRADLVLIAPASANLDGPHGRRHGGRAAHLPSALPPRRLSPWRQP